MTIFLDRPTGELKAEIPFLSETLRNYGLFPKDHESLRAHLDKLTEERYEDIGIDRLCLIENLEGILRHAENLKQKNDHTVSEITIIGGRNKSHEPENVRISLTTGSVTSIVGPTGSGKSRLLADIEWMAQNDTPTGRTILVNGKTPDKSLRFSLEYKLVAQLSQNMNFVMDTSVGDFVRMHAESRMIGDVEGSVNEIVNQANLLAGEPFTAQTPVTALSGGQSRALMIADTAFLSSSPVVLIDEIENAGIDRKKALSLLVKNEKIVLIATHDPILALMAEQRLIIRNGGIHAVITTTEGERANLQQLEEFDNKLLSLRTRLRNGERIETI